MARLRKKARPVRAPSEAASATPSPIALRTSLPPSATVSIATTSELDGEQWTGQLNVNPRPRMASSSSWRSSDFLPDSSSVAAAGQSPTQPPSIRSSRSINTLSESAAGGGALSLLRTRLTEDEQARKAAAAAALEKDKDKETDMEAPRKLRKARRPAGHSEAGGSGLHTREPSGRTGSIISYDDDGSTSSLLDDARIPIELDDHDPLTGFNTPPLGGGRGEPSSPELLSSLSSPEQLARKASSQGLLKHKQSMISLLSFGVETATLPARVSFNLAKTVASLPLKVAGATARRTPFIGAYFDSSSSSSSSSSSATTAPTSPDLSTSTSTGTGTVGSSSGAQSTHEHTNTTSEEEHGVLRSTAEAAFGFGLAGLLVGGYVVGEAVGYLRGKRGSSGRS